MRTGKFGKQSSAGPSDFRPPTDKVDYLDLKIVDDFIAYLAALLNGDPFDHRLRIRDKRLPPGYSKQYLKNGSLIIHSLESAFERYWWDRGNFADNKNHLAKVSAIVLDAIASEKQGKLPAAVACLNAIHEVLKWGAGSTGVSLYTKNMQWAIDNAKTIVSLMKLGREQMTSDKPDFSVFSAIDGPRMNAGFTKYYSLACGNEVIIYDGRVGAALGLLVQRFCSRRGLTAVPRALKFPWGAQNAIAPLNRNPSRHPYKFPRLPAKGGATWAKANIWANWVLVAARDKSTASWCKGQDGLRKIEAALFTIGYEIPPAPPSGVHSTK